MRNGSANHKSYTRHQELLRELYNQGQTPFRKLMRLAEFVLALLELALLVVVQASSIWVTQTFFFIAVSIAAAVYTFVLLLSYATGIAANLHHYRIKAIVSFVFDLTLFVLQSASTASIGYFLYFIFQYDLCSNPEWNIAHTFPGNEVRFENLYDCKSTIALTSVSLVSCIAFLFSLTMSARVFGPVIGARRIIGDDEE
ncbi:MAG: hypothetical protein SGCHY_001008 [Lobulomycetales sp.]